MLLLNKFREQLEKYSDKVALEMGNKHLTWKEVDTLSDQIAVTLKNTYKIQKDSCIPVYMESSFEMIIVLLGIFKVGAYYLPIHRDFPLTRKLDLIKESQSSIVILDKNISTTDNIKKIFWENLSNNKHTKNTKFDEEHGKFAYRIYTSGSTGKPKGVNVTQKNLEYILENLDSKFSVTPDDASILTTPFSFDVSVSELFSWIYGGGRLIIPNIKDNKMLLKYLPKEIIQHQVTHLALSPAVLSVLLQITDSDTKIKLNHYLKYVMVAGEEFPVKLANYAKKVLPDVRIFNLYGPTEGTVYATSYEIKEKCLNSVPIGKPLSNAKIVKKDPSKKISELIILGEGVAWGYWNNPQKTKEKFIKVNGQKGYLTGDLGEIDSHGNIIYHGRIDDQIQINGIRVELNEITTNVDKIDAVSKSYVLYKNRKLILFYTLNYPISQSIISKDLKQLLPSYMVPKRLVLLEKFPTNVNGKIDKNALIQLLRNDENVANATPENAEKIIKQTISKCLNIPSSIISNNTNIYTEIGMDSLASIEIIIELEKVMKQDIPLEILEKNPTVSDLSRALFNKSKEKFMDTRLSEMVRDKLNSQVKTFSRFRKSKAIKVVSLGHYQLNYLSSGFTSSISICLPVSDYKMQKMFRKKLAFLLENLDIFQTTIKREKNSFYQNMNWKYFDIPTIYYANKVEKAKNVFDDECVKSYSQNIYDTPFLRTFFYVDTSGMYFYFSMSHMICDLKSLNLINRFFISKEMKINSNYLEYLSLIKSNSNIEEYRNLADPKLLVPMNISRPKITVNGMYISNLGKTSLAKTDMENRIVNYCFTLGEILSKATSLKKIAISTIFSIRKIKNSDFTNSIGDFHQSIPLIYKSGDTKSSFNKRANNVISLMKKGNLIQEGLINKVEKKVFKLNQNVKVNFIGYIENNDIDQIYKMAIWLKNNHLDWLHDGRIRVLLFINSGNLYCIWQNQVPDLIKRLRQSGIETYKIGENVL